ncbi:MAG: branched-chain amino acid aminotransferase [Balneolaceae bacterium]
MKTTTVDVQSANGTATLSVSKTDRSRLAGANLDEPGFGTLFSDHMAVMAYRDGAWHTPEITPYDNFNCPPSLIALHYGQSVFEGMKAFRMADGTVSLYRPKEHFERLGRSCRRLCIPEPDSRQLLDTLIALIRTDIGWVPSKRGNALYVRPLIFGSDAFLGVRPSNTYTCLIMTSPVGAYYKEGINPVRLTTDASHIRAARGGTGSVKTAGNYAPTLLPARKAQENGFTQILWLDAKEHRYIEEVGTMNIFFKFKDKLVTPPAEGTILPGIIRDSVIQLAGEMGVNVEQRPITIDEVFESRKSGELEEIFGSGTAAVISPVGSITHNGEELTIDMEKPGPFTQTLYNEITAIQYGEKDDLFSWMLPVVD